MAHQPDRQPEATARREDEDRALLADHATGDAAAVAAPEDSFTDVMALAIEGSGTGLWDRDISTGEIRYSPGWKAILGFKASELSPQIEEAYARIHPDDLAYVQATMQAHFEGRTETYEVEHRLRCKDGSWKWVLSRGKVTARDAAGRALRMVGTTTDISATRSLTERLRRAEDELRDQREQLFQAQKMEAVGQLTGGLAHDFNNLLGAIMGNLELLRNRAQGRLGDLDRHVAAALDAASRGAALTHRLLAFSRRQSLDPKPANPNRLIAGMEELIQRTVGPEIKVGTRLANDIWSILCDANQLESAILNLCINARDAMPDGGTIVIETANTSLEDGSASRPDAAPRQYVEISIRDSGCGMSRDVLARAFDPFFTTKPTDQGTGLGLSMVYGFAKQSGGDVRIHSEVGAGTTVRLFLPRAHDIPTDHAEVIIPAAPNSAGRGKTILVVDDEPAIRMLLTEVLQEVGCYPLEAADGVAAMKVLQTESRIDLLITDVRMPGGLSGVELAARAQQYRPTLKVLFITGCEGGEPLVGVDLKPGMQVLHKPFTLEELVKKLNGLLA